MRFGLAEADWLPSVSSTITHITDALANEKCWSKLWQAKAVVRLQLACKCRTARLVGGAKSQPAVVRPRLTNIGGLALRGWLTNRRQTLR